MGMIPAQLTNREDVADGLAIFNFEISKPLDFISGQYNSLVIRSRRAEGPIARVLSIASSSEKPKKIEYFIRWVKKGGIRPDGQGLMTTELFQETKSKLNKLEFYLTDIPRGKLYPEEGEDRDIMMISTGTGLAPFMSQLRTAYSQAKDLGKYTLIHGVKSREDLAYKNEIETYSTDNNLRFLSTQPGSEYIDPNNEINYIGELFFHRFPDRIGRIKIEEIKEAINKGRNEYSKIEKIMEDDLTPERHLVMLCGNPNMINNMTTLLEAKGFIEGRDIISEKYWAAKKETFPT
jgi:ferredoxin/flavodoxin---NADP+ reductase